MAVAQGTKAEIITTKRTSTGPQPSRTRFGRLRAHLAEFAVGGRAAREVYDTLELRILIFSLVDRDTLAGMMRLEVAAVESVAGVLYRRVAGLYAHNMDTTTPRQVLCCRAVRVVDLNPVASLDKPIKEMERAYDEPAELLPEIEAWRGQFPLLLLNTILNDFPFEPRSDGYIVHLRNADGDIHIDLENHIFVDTAERFSPKALPKFPPCPTATGMTINHTIALDLYDSYEEDIFDEEELDEADNFQQWKAWLYDPANLDRRVSSVMLDVGSYAERLWEFSVEPGFEEAVSLVERRARDGCVPFSRFVMPLYPAIAAEESRAIVTSLGSGLRYLAIPAVPINRIGLQASITLLDDLFPHLQELVITPSGRPSSPAALSLRGAERAGRSARAGWIFHRVGSADCVYRFDAFNDRPKRMAINKLMKQIKFFRPEYAHLHEPRRCPFELDAYYDKKDTRSDHEGIRRDPSEYYTYPGYSFPAWSPDYEAAGDGELWTEDMMAAMF